MRTIVATLLTALMAFSVASADGHLQVATVAIDDSIYEVEIASDPRAWRKGLKGRQALADRRGMLFAFPDEGALTFWMESVDLPLDIAFFDRCGQLVDVLEHLPPCRTFAPFCPRYTSAQPAQFALEVNAGEIQSQQFQVGDQLIGLPFPNCEKDTFE